MLCKAINKAAFSCSWNVLDMECSRDRNSSWKCKRSGGSFWTRQRDGLRVEKYEGFEGIFFPHQDLGGPQTLFRQICAQTLPQWKSLFVWAVSGTSSWHEEQADGVSKSGGWFSCGSTVSLEDSSGQMGGSRRGALIPAMWHGLSWRIKNGEH